MPLPTSTVGKALEAAFPKAVPRGQLSNAQAAELMHSIHSYVVSLLGEAHKHMGALKREGKTTGKLRNEIHNKIQVIPKLLEPLKARYTKFIDVVGKDVAAKGYTVKVGWRSKVGVRGVGEYKKPYFSRSQTSLPLGKTL
jgi:hypothetical protein